jgi:hypothetical protein
MIDTAKVPGPLRDALLQHADIVAPHSAITERILGSKARADAEAFIQQVHDAVEQAKELEREEAARQTKVRDYAIHTICDGIAKMTHRLDALEGQRAEDAIRARRAERQKMLDALPDPDGAKPEPSLQPDPEGERPLQTASQYPQDEVGDPESDLPEGMGQFGLTGTGTEPELPEELGKPSSAQTPFAIGGAGL